MTEKVESDIRAEAQTLLDEIKGLVETNETLQEKTEKSDRDIEALRQTIERLEKSNVDAEYARTLHQRNEALVARQRQDEAAIEVLERTVWFWKCLWC